MDGLPEADNEKDQKPWHWARKFKVFVLTGICIVMTVLLLFLPEQRADLKLITVSQDLNYGIDIDEIYNMSRKEPQDTHLQVKIKGRVLNDRKSIIIMI